MCAYEILSPHLKIKWCEGFILKNERYTQVSGYIFDDKGEMLIVKNGKTWTIPGGHPEAGETPEQTLCREVMEEACVVLSDLQYIGAVEVVEDGEVYYQMRYVARTKDILPFGTEWEIDERKFVKIEEIENYITWANGKTFSAQLCAAKACLK